MAKAKKEAPYEAEKRKRREVIDWHRAELPGHDDEAELIEQFGLTLEHYHKAALKNDAKAMIDAALRAEAAVENAWGTPPGERYNGPKERFDCWHSAGEWLIDMTAAPDGEIPMYGQRGRFMLMIAGCRVDFRYDGLFGICGGAAHVIDLDHPFISETGFRSFQVCPWDRLIWTGGLAFEEYMRRVCEAQLLHAGDKKLSEPKLVMVDANDTIGRENPVGRHQWIKNQRAEDPAWQPGGYLAELPGLSAAGYAMRVERSGQMALLF